MVVPGRPGADMVVPGGPGADVVVPGAHMVVPGGPGADDGPGADMVVPGGPGADVVVPGRPGVDMVVPGGPGADVVVPGRLELTWSFLAWGTGSSHGWSIVHPPLPVPYPVTGSAPPFLLWVICMEGGEGRKVEFEEARLEKD